MDKYLTRMSACANLYGRIVSFEVEKNPHGLDRGWAWLSRTLSSAPFPSITASLLHGFLDVAAQPLLKAYGKQFHKVLGYLLKVYLPLVEKETLEGGHSDTVALRNMLEEYGRTGKLPKAPEGYRLLL